MSIRYKRRKSARNRDQSYDKIFEKKGVRSVTQYATPSTPSPNDREFNRIEYYNYAWSVGDRYWKLAHSIYGDKDLWYVIARFNELPTEADIEPGQIIRIPKNPNLAKRILGV